LHFFKFSGRLFALLAEVPDFSVESVFLRIFRQMKKSSRKIKEVMQMNIFETVKAAVTVRQAAEHYGLKINRSGMICCPFHDDRHPSLKPVPQRKDPVVYCLSRKR